MNSASLYRHANYVQRRDAQDILTEFNQIIQWHNGDTLIDIGCGSGDVTIDFILPIMPKNFKSIVGIDLSKEMIQHANKMYKNKSSKISFEVMDITTNYLNDKFRNKFDHVTSFYCLHWVHNQKKAIQNIADMLNKNGDCLLVFLASCRIYDVYKCLSKYQKYNVYMKDVDKFIAPLHYCENSGEIYSKLMESVGLNDYHVEVRDLQFIYNSVNILKKNVEAVNPFTKRMPILIRNEFLDEFVKLSISMEIGEKIFGTNDYKFISPYKLIVAYARK